MFEQSFFPTQNDIFEFEIFIFGIFFVFFFTVSFIVPTFLINLPLTIQLYAVAYTTVISKPSNHKIHPIIQNAPSVLVSIRSHLPFIYMTIGVNYSNNSIWLTICIWLANERQIGTFSFWILVFFLKRVFSLNKKSIFRKPVYI